MMNHMDTCVEFWQWKSQFQHWYILLNLILFKTHPLITHEVRLFQRHFSTSSTSIYAVLEHTLPTELNPEGSPNTRNIWSLRRLSLSHQIATALLNRPHMDKTLDAKIMRKDLTTKILFYMKAQKSTCSKNHCCSSGPKDTLCFGHDKRFAKISETTEFP